MLKIADYCFTHTIDGKYKKNLVYAKSFTENDGNNVGLTDLIADKIFDLQIAGVEQQVIKPEDFFDSLAKYNIWVDDLGDREVVEKILKLTSNDKNWLIVNNLITILGSLGIREHVPEDTPFLKYSALRGREIRTINRILYFLRRNGVKDVRDVKVVFKKIIFAQKVISIKESTKNKVIELWPTSQFFDILKEHNLTKAIELEESLMTLLGLSPDRLELIMISKLVKVWEQFSQSRYFKRFGIEIRKPTYVTSDTIQTKETVRKEDIKHIPSNSSHFSEVEDLTDDEKTSKSIKKIPSKSVHKKVKK